MFEICNCVIVCSHKRPWLSKSSPLSPLAPLLAPLTSPPFQFARWTSRLGAFSLPVTLNLAHQETANTKPPPLSYKMPVVGQGSCCGAYNISSWLAAGGTHIDTSCDYGSQPTVGAAVRASNAPRSSLWITSKLNVESCGTDMTAALNTLVLQPLGMSYVDLLLLHHAGRWETDKNPHPPCFNAAAAGPAGNGTYYECRMQTVQAMEALRAAGLIRVWGVSNWQVRDLEQMHDRYGFYPAINQIEHHPWWRESEVVAFCNKHGILVESYAPMGDGDRSHMRDAPIFAQLAAQYGVTTGQVIMSYNLQVGADIVIPRSATPSHQVENLNLFGPKGAVVTLSEVEVAAITSNHTYAKVYHTDCESGLDCCCSCRVRWLVACAYFLLTPLLFSPPRKIAGQPWC